MSGLPAVTVVLVVIVLPVLAFPAPLMSIIEQLNGFLAGERASHPLPDHELADHGAAGQ
jgi:hypothetical protein